MKKTAVIFVAALALFALCMMGGCAPDVNYKSVEESVPTINIQGSGKVEITPDEAVARFGVTSEEKLLGKAYNSNTHAMNAVISVVRGIPVKDSDIKTSSYTVTPVYQKDERGRQLPGKPIMFRVRQQLIVKIRDISRTGGLIDKVMANGANVFDGIRFSSSKIEEHEKEAKIRAAKDAREKAHLIAKSLGVKIGKVLKVNESSARPYLARQTGAFAESSMARSAPQIEPGSMEVTATCNVIYEIVQ